MMAVVGVLEAAAEEAAVIVVRMATISTLTLYASVTLLLR